MFRKTIFVAVFSALLVQSLGCGGGDAPEAESDAAPAAEEFVEVDPATAAAVTGKVSLEGDPPKMPPINMSAEPDCKGLHDHPVPARVVMAKDGALQSVFVWVKSGIEGKFQVPGDAVKLDQKGCIYRPHVLGVQTNQMLSVSNSDPTTHNVHPLPKVNREWNKSQSAGASPIERKFTRQEIMLPVKCNIHPWMRSYISVVDHPFFSVSGEDGTFSIKGLPPGSYTIEAVHEKFGSQESQVTLGASESKEVAFSFSAT